MTNKLINNRINFVLSFISDVWGLWNENHYFVKYDEVIKYLKENEKVIKAFYQMDYIEYNFNDFKSTNLNSILAKQEIIYLGGQLTILKINTFTKKLKWYLYKEIKEKISEYLNSNVNKYKRKFNIYIEKKINFFVKIDNGFIEDSSTNLQKNIYFQYKIIVNKDPRLNKYYLQGYNN